VLEEDLAGGSEVVLIDLRSDWIDRDAQGRPVENRGLILHHPLLTRGKLARLAPELLATIDAANPMTNPDFDGRQHFLDGPGYADPLAVDPDIRYWGAFEPVRYDVGGAPAEGALADRLGWVVLVQKQMLE
jgi:hypothetical protein